MSASVADAADDGQTVLGTLFIIKKSGKVGKGLNWYKNTSRKELIIGRDASCDVRVQVPTASRRHCRIRLVDAKEGVFVLENFSGINPTTLNEERTQKNQPIVLQHRAKIGVGDRYFYFEYGNGSTPEAATSAAIKSHIEDLENSHPNTCNALARVSKGGDDEDVTQDLSKYVRAKRSRSTRVKSLLGTVDESTSKGALSDRKKVRAEIRARLLAGDSTLKASNTDYAVGGKFKERMSSDVASNKELKTDMHFSGVYRPPATEVTNQEAVEGGQIKSSTLLKKLQTPLKEGIRNQADLRQGARPASAEKVLSTPLKNTIKISAALRRANRPDAALALDLKVQQDIKGKAEKIKLARPPTAPENVLKSAVKREIKRKASNLELSRPNQRKKLLATPLKRSIKEEALIRESQRPRQVRKVLDTPAKLNIIEAAVDREAAHVPTQTSHLPTPLKNDIRSKSSFVRYERMKSVGTPMRKEIKAKADQINHDVRSNPILKVLDTPLKKTIVITAELRNVSKANELKTRKQLDHLVGNSIKDKAAVMNSRRRSLPEEKLSTPLKTEISEKALTRRELRENMTEAKILPSALQQDVKIKAAEVAADRSSAPERALYTPLKENVVDAANAHQALKQQIIEGKKSAFCMLKENIENKANEIEKGRAAKPERNLATPVRTELIAKAGAHQGKIEEMKPIKCLDTPMKISIVKESVARKNARLADDGSRRLDPVIRKEIRDKALSWGSDRVQGAEAKSGEDQSPSTEMSERNNESYENYLSTTRMITASLRNASRGSRGKNDGTSGPRTENEDTEAKSSQDSMHHGALATQLKIDIVNKATAFDLAKDSTRNMKRLDSAVKRGISEKASEVESSRTRMPDNALATPMKSSIVEKAAAFDAAKKGTRNMQRLESAVKRGISEKASEVESSRIRLPDNAFATPMKSGIVEKAAAFDAAKESTRNMKRLDSAVKRGISEKASEVESSRIRMPDNALATPMKSGIVDKAAAFDAAKEGTRNMKRLESAVKRGISEKASEVEASRIRMPDKALATPMKSSIAEKAAAFGAAKDATRNMKKLELAVKRDITDKASKVESSRVQMPTKALSTPMKSGIVEKATAFDAAKQVSRASKKLRSALKRRICEKASEVETSRIRMPKKTLSAPTKASIVEKAAAFDAAKTAIRNTKRLESALKRSIGKKASEIESARNRVSVNTLATPLKSGIIKKATDFRTSYDAPRNARKLDSAERRSIKKRARAFEMNRSDLDVSFKKSDPAEDYAKRSKHEFEQSEKLNESPSQNDQEVDHSEPARDAETSSVECVRVEKVDDISLLTITSCEQAAPISPPRTKRQLSRDEDGSTRKKVNLGHKHETPAGSTTFSMPINVNSSNSVYSNMKISDLRQHCLNRNLSCKGTKATLISLLEHQVMSPSNTLQKDVNLGKEADGSTSIAEDDFDFSSLKVVELREKCEKRGIETHGRKIELIKRLNDHSKYHVGSNSLHKVTPKEKLSPENIPEFRKMKVADLRMQCDIRGLSSNGKKADLIARLEEGAVLAVDTDHCDRWLRAEDIPDFIPDFCKMNKTELREQCTLRCIEDTGKKAELIKRLEESFQFDGGDNDSSSKNTDEGKSSDQSGMSMDYKAMKVSDLRGECKRRGIDSRGLLKAQLVLALLEAQSDTD